MSESKNIYIYGYSGHSYVVIDILKRNNFKIMGYFDLEERNLNPYKLTYLGFEKKIKSENRVLKDYVFPALGNNQLRESLVKFYKQYNLKQTLIIDPSANVSNKSTIKLSTLVGVNATINSMVYIGQGCIINTGAIIEHECSIGDFSHIAPGAILAGNVNVGNRTFIGAGAIIKNGITIGDDVVVGAGAVVLRDLPDNTVWVGNPAKKLK